MKKIILSLALFLLFVCSNADAYQIEAAAKTKRIPMGTKIELETAHKIESDKVNTGDMFSSYLTRDVRTQTTMILPRGTVVRGSVLRVKSPSLPSKSGILYLNFDHVVAPNGSQLPISAGIAGSFNLDMDGGIKGGENYGGKVKQNWSKAGSIVKNSTQWGIKSGDDWFKGGKYIVTPFSATGGAIAGAGYFAGVSIIDLFRKGNNVDIEKGTVFELMLLEPLDVPVSE